MPVYPVQQPISEMYEESIVPVEKENHVDISADVRCNCYLYQKTHHFSTLPNTKHILSNLQDEIGDLAVFWYPSSGVHHYAKVVSTDGYNIVLDEANFSSCTISIRTITKDDIRLIGFFNT